MGVLMPKQNWKRQIPHSLVKALQLTKDHGKDVKNLSVARIADNLGENEDLLYKWLSTAKMPVNKVIALEQTCGINFVTQYFANSQGYLLVKAPTGRKAENKDLTDLQLFMTEVASLLIRFQQEKTDASEVIDAIKVLIQDLAFHERNVATCEHPQAQMDI